MSLEKTTAVPLHIGSWEIILQKVKLFLDLRKLGTQVTIRRAPLSAAANLEPTFLNVLRNGPSVSTEGVLYRTGSLFHLLECLAPQFPGPGMRR